MGAVQRVWVVAVVCCGAHAWAGENAGEGPSQQPAEPESVVVEPGGKEYHKKDCPHLTGEPTATVPLAAAKKQGYTPCKRCFPPRTKLEPKEKPAKRVSIATVRACIRDLDNEDQEARTKAVATLVAAGDVAAAEIQGYARMYPVPRRLAAMQVLEQIASLRAREALVARAVLDKDKSVRRKAAAAIARMGGEPALKYLITKSFSDRKKTRHQVARAFCNIGSKEYVDVFVVTACLVVYHGMARVDRDVKRYNPQDPKGSGIQSGVHALLPIKLSRNTELRTDTIVKTLSEVTGQGFGYDTRSWAKWWKENRDTFVFPDLEDKE